MNRVTTPPPTEPAGEAVSPSMEQIALQALLERMAAANPDGHPLDLASSLSDPNTPAPEIPAYFRSL